MKLAILIGHGKSQTLRYDPGACYSGYEEFKIARYIGKYAYEALKDIVDVELINFEGNMSLVDRIAKYRNDKETGLIMELHLNAGKGTGSEVYYYKGDSIGEKYAKAISSKIAGTFNIRDRGAKVNMDFGIVRETLPRALLVECCFIDSSDLELIKTDAGQKKMGEAIAEAVREMIGLTEEEKLYRVQVGAFKSKDNAQKLCQELKAKGYNDAYIV